MKLNSLIFLLLLHSLSPSRAETFLNSGDSVWASFSIMTQTANQNGAWILDHGTDDLSSGERYRVSFFENSIFEAPFLERTLSGSEDGYNGFVFFGYDDEGRFQDRQGAVRIDLLAGTLSLDAVSVVTEIGAAHFFARMTAFTPVPEPSAVGLLIAAAVAVPFCGRRFTKKRRD